MQDEQSADGESVLAVNGACSLRRMRAIIDAAVQKTYVSETEAKVFLPEFTVENWEKPVTPPESAMNFFVALCVVLLFFGDVAFVAAASDGVPLKIGIDSDYPPFSYKEDERYVGFDVETAEALCASMQRDCVFVALPFDALLAAMGRGELDMIFGVSATDERARCMDFSEPYFRARSMYMGKADNVPRSREEDGRKRIGVRAGTVQMEYLLRQWGDRAAIVHGAYGDILDKLCAGELDVVLANDLAGFAFLKSARGEAFDVVGDPLPLEVFPSVVRIGIRKGMDSLRKSVDEAITDIRFNGEYGRINRKYFPYSLY